MESNQAFGQLGSTGFFFTALEKSMQAQTFGLLSRNPRCEIWKTRFVLDG